MEEDEECVQVPQNLRDEFEWHLQKVPREAGAVIAARFRYRCTPCTPEGNYSLSAYETLPLNFTEWEWRKFLAKLERLPWGVYGHLNGMIWFSDGSFSDRHQYDGIVHWWAWHSRPAAPRRGEVDPLLSVDDEYHGCTGDMYDPLGAHKYY